MKANKAFEIIRRAFENPVQVWLDYSPKDTPKPRLLLWVFEAILNGCGNMLVIG